MGCCISKCRPDQHPLKEFNHVQDKLVFSQPPPTSIPLLNKISPSPPSPTPSSTSSISSFTCTTSNTISSTSSLSSASSALNFKDRSFSNEFLWSCYKENPHIIRINSLKEASLSLVPAKAQSKPSCEAQKVVGSSMPLKRVRSSTPTNLTRQKSFRKEPERTNSSYNLPSRTLTSPSPSRRFDSGSALATTVGVGGNSLSKRLTSAKANEAHSHSHSVSSLIRKENPKPVSPNNGSRRRLHSDLRHKESCRYRVRSKIEETVIKEVKSNHDMDSDMMEDIQNPHISLDCFIFL